MIRKSVQRFSLATNAGRVCAEIMLNQKLRSAMVIQPNSIALSLTNAERVCGDHAQTTSHSAMMICPELIAL
jgi:hypothetical protein